MAFTKVTQRTLEDHPFDADDPLVVQLRAPDVPTFDSLQRDTQDDVLAYVIFHFNESGYNLGMTANYQFVPDTNPYDGDTVMEGQCSICNSGWGPYFKCEVWFRSNDPRRLKYLCKGCLDSFLEIRDDLLEEFSGALVSEEL